MNFEINNARLGVQSWTLRDTKDFADVAKIVKNVGLKDIEICGCHVNVKDEKSCEYVLKVCSEQGITLRTMGVDGYSAKDKEGAEARFKFAKLSGMKYLAADPDCDDESVDFIENLCEKYGIKLIVHNHGRHHRYGNYEQLDALFSKFTKNVGLHMDAAWAMDAGLSPIEMATRYSDRFHGCHFKDFVFDKDYNPTEVILGKGALDIKGLAEVIKKAPEFGVMSIEYEAANPIEGLAECVNNFKNI